MSDPHHSRVDNVSVRYGLRQAVLSTEGVRMGPFRGGRRIPWSTVSSLEVALWSPPNSGMKFMSPELRLHDGRTVRLPGAIAWVNGGPDLGNSPQAERNQHIMEVLVSFCDQAAVPVDDAIVAASAAPFPLLEGWYRDPDDPSQLRWWDGLDWTATTQPRPVT
jgi:hypothetical protein